MQEDTSPQQDASAAASLAEKKRNKLGYHRTSVACVHCRRRKIRCLVDQNDQQGRCQNCIRLKKECNFFPVDQQPPNERQRRTGPKTSQSSSSPAPSSQGPGDAYPYGPPSIGYGAGGMSGISPQIAPINTQSFNPSGYHPSESPMSAPGHMSDTGTPFWSPYSAGPESARSAQFPNYPSARQEGWMTQMPVHHSQSMNPLGAAGPPPQQPRSMSLQHDGPGPYGVIPLHSSPFYDGRGGPPSLHNSNGSPATTVSLSDTTAAPGMVANPTLAYAISQQWDPKDLGGSNPDVAPAWYGNPVPSMPEESTPDWQQQSYRQTSFKQ